MLKNPNWLVVKYVPPSWLLIALWAALTFTVFVCAHQAHTIANQRVVIQLLERGCK